MSMPFQDLKKRFDAVRRIFDDRLGADAKPLEIRAAILNALEERATSTGRGRRVFPYNRIDVKVLLQPRSDAVPFESVLENLEQNARERFQEIRCDAVYPLDVRVSFVTEAPAGWENDQLFSLDCQKSAPAHQEAATAMLPLRVEVLTGKATEQAYTFTAPTILLGRMFEVSDPAGRRRRNNVVFDEATPSVSRAHARIVYDPARRGYRLLDDGSARGTQVVRRGDIIEVPRRDPRGVLLLSGDEIQLGEASVRVTIG
jgi:hypothetical protein